MSPRIHLAHIDTEGYLRAISWWGRHNVCD